MLMQPIKLATCRGVRPDSVVASIAAWYFNKSSTTLILFFLQAICNGVKPFSARAFGSADRSSNNFATSTCPLK